MKSCQLWTSLTQTIHLIKNNISNYSRPSLSLGMASRFVCLSFLFFFFTKGTAQSIFDQKVSISPIEVTIPEALNILTTVLDIEIAYSERFFEKNIKIDLDETDRSFRAVLEKILKNTGIGFKEIDGQVVLFKNPKKTLSRFTLSGYVEDARSGERLIAAAVYAPQLGIGTITNEYGFYSLTLPEDVKEITISYLGYQEEKKPLQLTKNQFATHQLSPSLTLAEIIVTPDSTKNELIPSPAGGTQIHPDDFGAAPDLGGESDLMRIAQLLPGVQTGADGLGGLHVRGGNADQNLVLLDGVPVYNPDHLLGIFSVFNTSAIKSAKFLRGGFPARYGGRVSSVFDIRTKEGSTRKWGAGAGIDLISGKAFVEGPFVKGKGSVLLTGRMTFSDFLLSELGRKAFAGLDQTDNRYEFYDANAKVSYQFSEKDRVYLSFYQGDDFFGGNREETLLDSFNFGVEMEINNDVELNWGNSISSLRWNHIFSPKLFANTTLTYSRYQFSYEQLLTISPEEEEDEEDDREYFVYDRSRSNIRDQAARIDFSYAPNAKHHLRFGGAYINHRFEPESRSVNSSDLIDVGDIDSLDLGDFDEFEDPFFIYADEMEAYLEDEFKVGEKWHFNLGLRFSGFFSDQDYFNLEPRLMASYHLTERIGLTASLTRNVQYLHRILFNEINLPEDLWFPSNEFMKPQDAWQTTLGVESNLPGGFSLSVEGYYKKMKNIYVVVPSSDASVLAEDVDLLKEDGLGYGVEFFIRKSKGKTGGWLSYTISESERDFINDLEQKVSIHSSFDRRHDFKLFLYRWLNNHWQVSMNWIYGTPMPQLRSAANDSESLIFPENLTTPPPLEPYHQRPALRSDPYHRLDVAISYSLKKKKFEHTFKASIYNVYGRKNPAFYQQDFEPETGNFIYEPVNLLPFMPGVYYGVRFSHD